MAKVPTFIPVTELHQNAVRVLNEVKQTSEPVFITEHGQATGVLMSLQAYERSAAERELLKQLACGEKEIHRGIGHSIDDILAETDALLTDD